MARSRDRIVISQETPHMVLCEGRDAYYFLCHLLDFFEKGSPALRQFRVHDFRGIEDLRSCLSDLTKADGVSASDVDNKSMALWFALDRFEAFREYRPKDVDVLLINRYVLSNAVYQSIRERDLGGGDLLEFVMELEYGHFQIPRPDVHIYLDVNIEEAGENVLRKGYREYAGAGKDVYESQTGMQRRARKKYLEYATRLPNVYVVPCMAGGQLKPAEEIGKEVESLLKNAGLLW